MKKIILAVGLLFLAKASFCATYYVSTVSGDNTDGLSWATAKQSITGGLALATADQDVVFVDSAHSSTTLAAVSLNAATTNTHVSVISVDRCGLTTTGHCGWLPGALETEDSGATAYNIANSGINQSLFFSGITFRGDDSSSSGNDINIGRVASSPGVRASIVFSSCTFTIRSTGSGSEVAIGMDGSSAASTETKIQFYDCKINGGNYTTSNVMAIALGTIEFVRLTLGFFGASKPASAFGFNANAAGAKVSVIDSDLTGYNKSGGAYVAVGGLTHDFTIRNCKFHAVPALQSGTFIGDSGSLLIVNSASTNTVTAYSYYNRLGTLSLDTSIYYPTGTKFNGSNASWKIITTASAGEGDPFTTPWLMRWSDSTSAMTGRFAVVSDSTTVYNNRNMWGEIEYVSSTTLPLGGFIVQRDSAPFDSAAVDWPTDSNVWVGTGSFTNVNANLLSSTFTPGQGSFLRGRLNVGVASQTLYLDPQLILSTEGNNPTIVMDEIGAIVTQPGTSGTRTIYDATIYDSVIY